jgi:1-acyl-sn-glycerol-3-phosphate acyltransferase
MGISKFRSTQPDMVSSYHRQAILNQKSASRICRSHGLRIQVRGNASHRPAVYVANHQGYIDPFIVIAHAPMLPVAKMETSGWPILGRAMNASGVLFVQRGNPISGACLLRRAMHVLASGVSVLNFPEGTTTSGDTIMPFQRGFFGVARLMNIPVVPVCIKYLDPSLAWYGDTLFFPHYLNTASKKRIDVKMRFCDAVWPDEHSTPEVLAAHCRKTIMAQLADQNIELRN